MTPDKLPQEIADKIKSDASAYSDIPRFIAYTKGAIAWAPWKVKHDELKTLLHEFVSNHEAGLLPNRFVYEKAIKILNDGTR